MITGCIPGTYCLFDGLCCANEMDPETCASNSGLELPEDFSRPAIHPSSAEATASTDSEKPDSTDSEEPNSTDSEKPASTEREAPTSFPTVDRNFGVPTEALPITTTFDPITVSASDGPMTLAYSGEVIPLQTPTSHKPVSESFKDDVLAALAKDPDTRAFGELLEQEPSFFDALDESKEYYIFAPTTDHVVEYLRRLNAGSQGLGKRAVQIRPNEVIQAAEKPKGGPDIKRVATTLKTVLLGYTNFVNLGKGEGARVVSQPTSEENGEVHIVSGFGNSTLVHADDIPFEKGVIKKCDG